MGTATGEGEGVARYIWEGRRDNNQLDHGRDNYNLIEAVYEGYYHDKCEATNKPHNTMVKRWHTKYPEDTDRLEAILKNII